MSIKLKMTINALVFIFLAIIFACQEMYMMHPDAIDWFSIKM